MKKSFRYLLVAVMAVALIFGLAACGGPSAEKLKELDDKITQYDTDITSAQAEMDKITGYMEQYDIPSFQENYDKLLELVGQMDTQRNELLKGYNENKASFSAEKVDEVITQVDTLLQKSDTFLTSMKATVAEVEAATATAAPKSK